MSFVISKIFWFIFNIQSVIILSLFAGLILSAKRPRVGYGLIIFAFLSFVVCSVPFVPHYLVQKLETRILPGKVTSDISGIIVLGGILDMGITRQGHIELLDSADRIVYGVILARQYPKAKLILTGGSGMLDQAQNFRESDYLKKLAVALGIEPERIIVERNARRTYEHPQYLSGLIDKKQKFVLITSAAHMPRAFGCFKKAGFNVIPYPVDYHAYRARTSGISVDDFIPEINNLMIANDVVYEWYGLAYYRLMGYTGEFFPARSLMN